MTIDHIFTQLGIKKSEIKEKGSYPGIIREVSREVGEGCAYITIYGNKGDKKDYKNYIREFFPLDKKLFMNKEPKAGYNVVFHVWEYKNGTIDTRFEIKGPTKKNVPEEELKKAKKILEEMAKKYGL